MRWLFDNSNDSFSIKIGQFTAPRGIDLDDITEAVYLAKSNRNDPDVDSAAYLELGSGLTKVAGATEADAELRVQFRSTDFGDGALEANNCYHACIGIKIAGFVKFLEIELQDSSLSIVQDCIHD